MIKPNTILPKGGRLRRSFRKKVGAWVEMTFDAEVRCAGVRWLRVNGGMGGRGDREDWVADVPHVCISVHDYQYREPYWGLERYPSFEAACRVQLKEGIAEMHKTFANLKAQVREMAKSVKRFDP